MKTSAGLCSLFFVFMGCRSSETDKKGGPREETRGSCNKETHSEAVGTFPLYLQRL